MGRFSFLRNLRFHRDDDSNYGSSSSSHGSSSSSYGSSGSSSSYGSGSSYGRGTSYHGDYYKAGYSDIAWIPPKTTRIKDKVGKVGQKLTYNPDLDRFEIHTTGYKF
ncbi:hypothetical protein H4219_002926 [Mycoemilia scoparia]|uniref:Uncharacterized protein n=1 Tax=Mycoemilia scoparia TaxID=417184 RepID=A0A9W8DTR2_9FUNG|nr:hypothetical protein H4219_002926 [Mycoemilia scoparia]